MKTTLRLQKLVAHISKCRPTQIIPRPALPPVPPPARPAPAEWASGSRPDIAFTLPTSK